MLCGQHYQGEPGSEDCELVHLPRLKVERDHAWAQLREAITHSITSSESSRRTVEDPYRAAEYATNMLTIHKTELLVELARLFGTEDPSIVGMADAARMKAEANLRAMTEQCASHAREIDRLRAALEEIAGLDHRGYPHESARIAHKALGDDR